MNGENPPEDCYQEPDSRFFLNKLGIIDKFVKSFCEVFKIERTKLYANPEIFRDIIIRMDERRLYFHVFHRKMIPNECKMVALFVFWVLKLRPLSMAVKENFDVSQARFAASVNEKFCLFLLCAFLKRHNPEKLIQILSSKDYLNELSYSFRFRDLSKEALYLIFDSCAHC